MRLANHWKDYVLLDTSHGERLEKWGGHTLIRPDPQVIWKTPRDNAGWKNADARYLRSKSGGGSWENYRRLPDSWRIDYQFADDGLGEEKSLAKTDKLTFNVKPMGFKHTGLFPEQAVNWEWMRAKILRARAAGRKEIRVLNMFAYTGGATLACLSAGAYVCHVDASKGMTAWAKENAAASGLSDLPQRWIVEDCGKFVDRENRRGSRYDAIIMDPPSYGRGPGGEIWKLEDQIYELVERTAMVLSEDPLFFIINSYTTGLSPSVMKYILESVLGKNSDFTRRVDKRSAWRKCVSSADEIGLPVTHSGLALPCGATAVMESGE